MGDNGGIGDDFDSLLARIGRWRDDSDAAASALARRRRHWLRQQAAEATTLAGVLLTLAEREAPVIVRTAAGGQRGTLTSVTTALCTLSVDDPDGRQALIPIDAITALTAVDGGVVNDHRMPAATTDLAAALAGLAPDRPLVTLCLGEASTITGTLAMVGADVVGVGAGVVGAGVVGAGVVGAGPESTYVPLGAIACCLVGRGADPN